MVYWFFNKFSEWYFNFFLQTNHAFYKICFFTDKPCFFAFYKVLQILHLPVGQKLGIGSIGNSRYTASGPGRGGGPIGKTVHADISVPCRGRTTARTRHRPVLRELFYIKVCNIFCLCWWRHGPDLPQCNVNHP